MPYGLDVFSLFTTVDVSVVTTAETVIAGPLKVSTTPQSLRVDLRMYCSFLTGASVTAVVVRCRRGIDATGTLIGEAITHTIGAAANVALEVEAQDTPGEVAGQNYVWTIVQTAATGNGTAANSLFTATTHN